MHVNRFAQGAAVPRQSSYASLAAPRPATQPMRMRSALRHCALWAAIVVTTPGIFACGGSNKATQGPTVNKKKMRSALSAARDAARAHDYAAADDKYAEAFQFSGDLDIATEHIDVLLSAKIPELAEAAAKRYVDQQPKQPRLLGLYADALLAREKGKAALAVADQILELDADDYLSYEKRGRALVLLGRGEEALEALRKAASMAPEETNVLLALGQALVKSGNYNEAALQFRAAYRKAPDDPDVLVALAGAVREQKDYDEALRYLQHAIEIEPANAEAHYELGILHNRMGNTDSAVSALAKATELGAGESRYWYAYGEIFRVQNQTDRAIEAYQRAVELDPPHPKAAAKLGMLLTERKKYTEAEQVLTVAIRKDAKNALNYLNLGVVYAGQRRNQLAISMFQKFLDLAPPNDEDRKRAKDAITELKRK